MTAPRRFSVGRVTRFYVPLLLQAFTQCLTYPLVAGIVAHGAMGVNAFTAFTQGQIVMFMIGSLGGGLIMTGMVFAKTREGYLAYRRMNALLMASLLSVQCLTALPALSRLVFGGLFALPPDMREIARWTLLGGVVMNGGFFLRNVPMVVLFDNLESGKANTATFVRILSTLACAFAFPRMGCVGPAWGMVALTLGVVLETFVTWLYARPYVRAIMATPAADGGADSTVAKQLRFTLPLSVGYLLLSVSPLLVAAFVGRSAAAADMLAVHYVTLGVANPVAFGAMRMQAVAIEFPPERSGDRRLMWYAIAAGAVLGAVPLAFATPLVGDWYFAVYQNVPPRILGTARLAIGLYAAIGVVQALRGRAEGMAALRKRPGAVMSGQIAYTVSILAVLSLLLPLGVPGWAMAVSAIVFAPLAATMAVCWRLRTKQVAKLPLDGRGMFG